MFGLHHLLQSPVLVVLHFSWLPYLHLSSFLLQEEPIKPPFNPELIKKKEMLLLNQKGQFIQTTSGVVAGVAGITMTAVVFSVRIVKRDDISNNSSLTQDLGHLNLTKRTVNKLKHLG
uniref:Transmembrane protein n=1 Tax=Lactuca sativa TaxID=4236 RepID=A0A9R1UFB2_LACSA|nr:hypothetical protein LSAT_V11C900474020 [Lactuca sativa]